MWPDEEGKKHKIMIGTLHALAVEQLTYFTGSFYILHLLFVTVPRS